MKQKEIYGLGAVVLLIVIFVWWGASRNPVANTLDNSNPETTNTPTTKTVQKTQSSGSVTKSPSSVNPLYVPPKAVPTIPTAKSLAGSTYRLVTYNGMNLPADSKLTLTFTETNFSLKLCNTLSSTYYIDNNNLFKVTNLVSTAMYCSSPDNIMRIESDTSLLLNSGLTSIYKSGSTLILSGPQGIVLSFEGF